MKNKIKRKKKERKSLSIVILILYIALINNIIYAPTITIKIEMEGDNGWRY